MKERQARQSDSTTSSLIELNHIIVYNNNIRGVELKLTEGHAEDYE